MARQQRSHGVEFKRQVVQEYISMVDGGSKFHPSGEAWLRDSEPKLISYFVGVRHDSGFRRRVRIIAWRSEGSRPMGLVEGADLSRYNIHIELTPERFLIKDNCGGMSLTRCRHGQGCHYVVRKAAGLISFHANRLRSAGMCHGLCDRLGPALGQRLQRALEARDELLDDCAVQKPFGFAGFDDVMAEGAEGNRI